MNRKNKKPCCKKQGFLFLIDTKYLKIGFTPNYYLALINLHGA